MTITTDITAQEFKVHGVIGISNTGGIEVMLNRSNDGVYYRFTCGEEDLSKEPIYEAELIAAPVENQDDENDETEMGFQHGECFYSLALCMAVNR